MPLTNGASLNSIPSPSRSTLQSNYIDFTSTATAGWAQQYLPDLMEKEAEVFGNRTVSGFLSQVGAEEPMTSDQVIWSEQARLHLAYNCDILSVAASSTIGVQTDIDGNTPQNQAGTAAVQHHGVRVGDTLVISDTNSTVKAYVSNRAAATGVLTVEPYTALTLAAAGFATGTVAAGTGCRIFVYGSEYIKATNYADNSLGTAGTATANYPVFTSFTNKPIILRDYYEISGSDTSQIGWVEVSGEDGTGGYLWYLKAEGDTRARFTDYLEMAMIEGEQTTVTAAGASEITDFLGTTAGTQGLFSAVTARGNQASLIVPGNPGNLGEFDTILAEFDRQGSIEENMIFANRATALAIDDMLATMNSYGGGGTSYGVFNNEESMALNLVFSGFRRGSYDFYKTDWKYLNDFATRGGILDTASNVRGIFIPAGTSSVYDQMLGKNLKRPFLHVRYRASQADDRRFKTWVTGSVGAVTSDLDAMQIHYLSERCLVTQGANNFMLLT